MCIRDSLKDIDPGPSGYYSGPAYLTPVGGNLFFTADDGATGEGLWKTDGTTAGTVLVKDFEPAVGGYYSSGPAQLTAVGGTLFFRGSDGTTGDELWKSNGTAGGTVRVKDIDPGAGGSYPDDFTAAGSTLFFTASPSNSRELWKSDGTAAGTVQLTEAEADTTAPDTTIVSGPANGSTITTSSATFGFSGTPGDTAKLQCSLDGGAFANCTSPHTFSGLANGSHTVAFRAVDAAGNNDPTPAQRTFTVNVSSAPPPTTAPTAPTAPSNAFTAPATGQANTKKATLALSVTLPGPGTLAVAPAGKSPIKAVEVTVSKAGAATITIKLTKDGLKKLKAKKSHKLKVKVQFTYTPTGGTANTLTKSYTLTIK